MIVKAIAFQDEDGPAPVSKEDCTQSRTEQSCGEERGLEYSKDTPADSSDNVSVGGADSSDEEEHEHDSSDASSGPASSSSRCTDDALEEGEDKQDAQSSDMNQAAECSLSEGNSQDANPGSNLLPTKGLLHSLVVHRNLSLSTPMAATPHPFTCNDMT